MTWFSNLAYMAMLIATGWVAHWLWTNRAMLIDWLEEPAPPTEISWRQYGEAKDALGRLYDQDR